MKERAHSIAKIGNGHYPCFIDLHYLFRETSSENFIIGCITLNETSVFNFIKSTTWKNWVGKNIFQSKGGGAVAEYYKALLWKENKRKPKKNPPGNL